jgi:hypothetical protein
MDHRLGLDHRWLPRRAGGISTLSDGEEGKTVYVVVSSVSG